MGEIEGMDSKIIFSFINLKIKLKSENPNFLFPPGKIWVQYLSVRNCQRCDYDPDPRKNEADH